MSQGVRGARRSQCSFPCHARDTTDGVARRGGGRVEERVTAAAGGVAGRARYGQLRRHVGDDGLVMANIYNCCAVYLFYLNILLLTTDVRTAAG